MISLKQTFSLKTAWYGMVFGIVLLPTLTLGPWLLTRAFDTLVANAILEEQGVNTRIAHDIDQGINELLNTLRNKSDAFEHTFGEADVNNAVMHAVMQREPGIQALHIIDSDGKIIGQSIRPSAFRTPIDYPIDLSASPPALLIPLHGREHLGSYVEHEGQHFFHITLPIGPPDQPFAALMATVSVEELVVKKLSVNTDSGITRYIVDSRGSLITAVGNTTADQMLTDKPIIRSLIAQSTWNSGNSYVGINHTPVFGLLTSLNPLGWGAISEIPRAMIYAPVLSFLAPMVIATVVMIAVLLLLGLWLSNKFLQPLAELTGHFMRAKQGDYAHTSSSSQIIEFNVLTESYGEMVHAVEDRQKRIEASIRATRQAEAAALNMMEDADSARERLQGVHLQHEEAQRIAHLGHWELDLIKNTTLSSDEQYRIMGLDPGRIITYEIFVEAVHPDDREFVNKAYTESVKSRTPYDIEHRLLMQDGSIKWVHERCKTFYSEDGKPLRSIGTTLDITERKQLEEANHRQIRYLQSMQQIADAVSGPLTSGQMLDHVIKAVREIFAADRAWLFYPCDPDADFWEIPVESTLPEFPGAFSLKQKFPMNSESRQVVNDALNALTPVVYCPVPDTGENLAQFSVQSQMMLAVRPKFGKPWLLGLHQCSHERAWSAEEQRLFQDIGSRLSDMLSAAHLNRDLQKMSQAMQQAGESVLITDRNGIIEYVNPACAKITGYTPEEMIGQTPSMFKSSVQDPAFYKELWDTVTSGEVWNGTLIDRRKDGSFYPALMSVAPIHNDSGEITHYVSIQQDMTEYKRMEEQFLQAQKMEAIGTLVGGIAHDFNNMLAAIQGNVYLSRRNLEGQPAIAKRLDNIELLGIRAAEMVNQLLTFARKDRVKMKSLSFNAFLREAYNLARASIPENIELICDTCEEPLIIHGDATQLQQVLMNLVNNARDAVSQMDQPRVSCSLTPFVATDVFHKKHPDSKETEFAVLTVRDNGSGIKKEHLHKVFEPFFTTKSVGQGTGLGLAMVYGAVRSHAGIIEVESELGAGTVIRIYLPLKVGVEKPTRKKESVSMQGRGETILLVDDEESMRDTTGEVLNSLGYKILSAGDGEDALELFRAHQAEISLVLTDVVMPKMGGFDLARSIRQYDQTMPIIFATGYDKGQVMSLEDQMSGSVVISKPFSFEEISQLIRTMIEPE